MPWRSNRRDRILLGVPFHYWLGPGYWRWLAARRVERLRRSPVGTPEHYRKPEDVVLGAMDPRLVLVGRIVRAAGARRVLDLGCGHGRSLLVLHLLSRPAPPAPLLVGVDRRWKQVRTARGVTRPVGLPPRWLAADARGRLPFADGAFDLVLAFACLSETDGADADAARREALRVARRHVVLLDETHRTVWTRPHDEAAAFRALGARVLADRILPARWLPNPRAARWFAATRLVVAAAGPAGPDDEAVATAAAT